MRVFKTFTVVINVSSSSIKLKRQKVFVLKHLPSRVDGNIHPSPNCHILVSF